MKKALVIIDMQNDFIDGSLANPDAKAIIPAIVQRIREFDGAVFATRDTHATNYLQSPEGKHLPVEHCIKDTDGWQIQRDILAALQQKNATILDKPTFGYLGWGVLAYVDEVELVGTCTDICVVSNALILKAMFPALTVKVNAALCAGTSKTNHDAALQTMRMCQVEVI